MKTGFRRKLDNLGRVTIPKEYREYFEMKKGEMVAITEVEDGVLISNPEKKKEQEKAE